MQPPSLYSHFASKNAIYDAMFEQAWGEFHAALEREVASLPTDPRGRLLALATTYFDFAVSDLERHQLMDMPMLRDFTPTEDTYRPAVEYYEVMRSVLREIGIRRDADLDLHTALTGGFVNQQLANDPKGDRWRALARRHEVPALRPHLSADHDAIVVADIVSEWADRHGKDFTMNLTGPAGGSWTVGSQGPRIDSTPSTSAG